MDVINVVRQLTKGKVQLCELDMPLPEKKRIQIEALLQTARAYLVQIKKKIKEKSEFTKLFKSNLTDDERASLKQKVSVLSKEIKEVESALKVCEQELALVLERQPEERVPLQFQFSSEDCTVAESTTFQVMNDINSWASDWKQFLSTFTAHSSYHRIEWLNVLSAYSGFNVYLFVVKVEGKIVKQYRRGDARMSCRGNCVIIFHT